MPAASPNWWTRAAWWLTRVWRCRGVDKFSDQAVHFSPDSIDCTI